jgi:hypothetical protein
LRTKVKGTSANTNKSEKMRKTILTLLIFVLTWAMGFAQQNEIADKIDKQYFNKVYQNFIYQVSPHAEAADKWTIKNYQDFQESLLTRPVASFSETSSDTSWGYSEYKLKADTVFSPSSYTNYFSLGDQEDFVTHYNSFTWKVSVNDWTPNSLQTTWTKDDFIDSVKTYYYRNFEEEPYYGSRNIYIKEPTEGADYEFYRDNYDPAQGWIKNQRELRYRDENGYDTLTVGYSYDVEAMEYVMDSKNRNIYTDTYQLNESIYWFRGEINSWSWSYLKLGEDGRYIYQVSKRLNSNTGTLVGRDSLHYYYYDDYTEGRGFEWNSDIADWELTQLYRSYQRPFENSSNGYVVDSVLVYSYELNESTGEYEVGAPYIKTEMEYDDFGNQIVVKNYIVINEELTLQSRVIREFLLLGTYYAQVKQEFYGLDFQTGELYRGSISETLYDSTTYIGNRQFNFTAAGDTTSGYSTDIKTDEDGTRYTINFQWDNNVRELLLTYYRITRQVKGDLGTINQYYTIETNRTTRSMNGYNRSPGVFNDGPLFIEVGDTLSLYVSARNPDMSIPDVTVSNMPSTATYDPETKHFFWIVDEGNPSPMTYTAIRGDIEISTQVEFRSESFTVDNEGEVIPEAFLLAQNYPNPFNPSTVISYQLAESSKVKLEVFDMLGRKVAVLVNTRVAAGAHSVNFDASNLSSGMYIYRLQADNFLQTRKMMLIK